MLIVPLTVPGFAGLSAAMWSTWFFFRFAAMRWAAWRCWNPWAQFLPPFLPVDWMAGRPLSTRLIAASTRGRPEAMGEESAKGAADGVANGVVRGVADGAAGAATKGKGAANGTGEGLPTWVGGGQARCGSIAGSA